MISILVLITMYNFVAGLVPLHLKFSCNLFLQCICHPFVWPMFKIFGSCVG